MTKNKTWMWLALLLLLINIALVVFMLNRPHARKGMLHNRQEVVTAFLQKEIGFNKQQLQQYDTLARHHRESIMAIFDTMRLANEQQLKKLAADNFTDSAIIRAATLSAGRQQQIELLMLKHFKEMRNLCTQEQKAKFDTGFYKIGGRRGGMKKLVEKNKN